MFLVQKKVQGGQFLWLRNHVDELVKLWDSLPQAHDDMADFKETN